ncbi:MAG: hypothetical protein DMG30_07850 [Acidobacteria bacterium]|nr:MAG: hypothetical protein DMG30_07850 [Acidobacteriota bacterium]
MQRAISTMRSAACSSSVEFCCGRKFTGKQRDSESNLDYFGARYYASTMGRFLTPDWTSSPSSVPYADFSDPQSLNQYSYVRNNPLSRTDADGHCDPEMVCPDTEPTPDLKTQLEIAKGIGKELVNTIISTLNLVSSVDAPGLDDPSVGIPLLTPSNDLQEGGMGGTSGIITGLGVLSTTAAGAEAIATRGAGEASTVLPKEGVYEGPDATVPGRTYVGQSGDIPSRLARHEASGKFAPGTKVSTTEVTGGKTAREVAEHNRIQNLGGVRSRPGSKTSNVRNPIGKKRQNLLKQGSTDEE